MNIKKFSFVAVFAFIIIMIILVFLNSNYFYSIKLSKAIEKGDIIGVNEIIERNPESINTLPSILPAKINSLFDIRIYYPLTLACKTGNTEIIVKLIESGADVNCNNGYTPLSITYQCKNSNWYDISEYLIENGADINYTTSYSNGYSSALYDIVSGYSNDNEDDKKITDAFKFIFNNCDKTIVDWKRVLYRVVFFGRTEILEFLVENDYCNINERYNDNMTLLMFAVRDSTIEMVKFLLENGADITMVDNNGKTAYDYALEKGNQEIIDLLS